MIVEICNLFYQVIRMVVSTYQAASGAGAAAMRELELQTQEVYPISVPKRYFESHFVLFYLLFFVFLFFIN